MIGIRSWRAGGARPAQLARPAGGAPISDTRAAVHPREPSRDAGLSLAELLVAMMIFAIILAVVSSLYVNTVDAMNTAEGVNQNTREASNMMDEAARMIREATPNPVQGQTDPAAAFVSATNESVVLYAFVNLTGTVQQPIMVEFSLDANRNLVETTWQSSSAGGGYWTFPAVTSTPSSVRVLGGAVAPQSGSSPWLFTYLDSNGNEIAPSSTTLSTGAIPAASLQNIAFVQIDITAQASASDPAHSVTVQDTVGLSNVADSGSSDQS